MLAVLMACELRHFLQTFAGDCSLEGPKIEAILASSCRLEGTKIEAILESACRLEGT